MTENYAQTLSCNDFIPTLSKGNMYFINLKLSPIIISRDMLSSSSLYSSHIINQISHLTFYTDLPCAARGADGMWHRGIIKAVTENTIRVFYVDLGYTLVLSYDAVRALPKKYMSCKTQVSLCQSEALSFPIVKFQYSLLCFIYSTGNQSFIEIRKTTAR